jgi:energy-coupling factor transporter ATP-binding protein EcfA2
VKIEPLKEEFLAVVTSWSSYGGKGGQVGNAVPVFCTSRNEVVDDPMEIFPDRGNIFLVNRGQVLEWDFVLVRPKPNMQYYPGKSYYLSFDFPNALETAPADCKYAGVLDVPVFDPAAVNGIIRTPAQNATPVFYARFQRKLFGPLRRVKVNRRSGSDAIDSIQWAPLGDDHTVYEFTEEELPRHKLERHTFRHPNPDNEAVAANPIYLLSGPVLTAKSDKVHDRLSPSELAEWYLRWREMPEVPENLMKVFRSAPDYLVDSSSEIVRQRCRRLATLFVTLDVLQTERATAVARFVDSESGQRMLKQQMDREVERRAKQIDTEVASLKKEQSKEKYRIKQEMDGARSEHQKKLEQMTKDMDDLEHKRSSAEAAVNAIQKQMQDGVGALTARLQEELPAFAALSSGLRPAVVTSNGHVGVHDAAPTSPAAIWGKAVVPAPTKDLDALNDEVAFVDQLAWELASESLFFTRDFLANLYITLKASGLNLIMGPPGYGKSSVVSALARAMGHGNALLEIAVRRTWSDDRYLLGFYDTFHNRYDPGPTGLATRLLQAQIDWEQGRHGIYLILMDEFNLAAPEYYFSQLLQVLTRPANQERLVRLYDAGSQPSANGNKPIDQLRLYPNISFWGTINYDETTERLSPRLLDRTGMIFLSVRDIVPPASTTTASVIGKGVLAGQLVDRFVRGPEQCPEGPWELIEPLLALLKKQSEEWGAGIDLSPRVLEAVRRFLANSRGLLPIERAVDFVFEQRVLPVMRGRGPKFTARVKALAEKLTEKSLERSARHVQDALVLAEVNFGDVDFLAY